MTQRMSDLIDLETLVKLQKSAPRVTRVPADVARMAVEALIAYRKDRPTYTDLNGRKYWKAQLKDLHDLAHFGEATSIHALGQVYRMMGLVFWRQNDGFHVAWSAEQLAVLVNYFAIDLLESMGPAFETMLHDLAEILNVGAVKAE